MGLDYQIHCFDCNLDGLPTEYSAVGYVQIKHPDEAEQVLVDWTKFLVEHHKHKIGILDAFGNETNPEHLSGRYILGIDKSIEKTSENK